MRNALLIVSALILTVAAAPKVDAQQLVVVPGYMRLDGTYVPAHVRSVPDATTANNLNTAWVIAPPPPARRDFLAEGAALYSLGQSIREVVVPSRPTPPPVNKVLDWAPAGLEPLGWRFHDGDSPVPLYQHPDLRASPAPAPLLPGDSVWLGAPDRNSWAAALDADGRVVGYVFTNSALAMLRRRPSANRAKAWPALPQR